MIKNCFFICIYQNFQQNFSHTTAVSKPTRTFPRLAGFPWLSAQLMPVTENCPTWTRDGEWTYFINNQNKSYVAWLAMTLAILTTAVYQLSYLHQNIKTCMTSNTIKPHNWWPSDSYSCPLLFLGGAGDGLSVARVESSDAELVRAALLLLLSSSYREGEIQVWVQVKMQCKTPFSYYIHSCLFLVKI